jgi:beta-glucosidase
VRGRRDRPRSARSTAVSPADDADVRELAARFPPSFRWGVATAAYQIEGSAEADGKGPSIWDGFAHVPGRVRGGETGDVACDHYRRYREDVALMAGLGVTDYRFSISWARVLPEGVGPVNEAGLDFYDALVDELLEQGIRPLATLYHWDLPLALHRRGGWDSDEAPGWFAELAGAVAHRLGDRVSDWITINEPAVAAYVGYGEGRHAPGCRDWSRALRAGHRMLLAHETGRGALVTASSRAARVGIALSLVACAPAGEHDDAAADRLDGHENRWFLDPLFGRGYPSDMLAWWGEKFPEHMTAEMAARRPALDFLGINYYTRHTVRAGGPPPLELTWVDRGTCTAMSWEVYPEGLTEILLRVTHDLARVPLIVTENGAAYDDQPDASGEIRDEDRRRFLELHIAAAADALDAGAQLEGYFAWSLLDNFEWAEGYRRRFGLVRVDYATQERTVKRSGRWYADLIRAARAQTLA